MGVGRQPGLVIGKFRLCLLVCCLTLLGGAGALVWGFSHSEPAEPPPAQEAAVAKAPAAQSRAQPEVTASEAVPETARTPTPGDTSPSSDDEQAPSGAGLFFGTMTLELMEARHQRGRELKKKRLEEYLAKIEQETIEESVYNLFYEVPFGMARLPMGSFISLAPEKTMKRYKQDPRVVKLFAIADDGTDEERAALLEALMEMGRVQVGDLPGNGKPFRGGQVVVAPILMAHADSDGGSLPLLVRMGDHEQHTFRRPREEDAGLPPGQDRRIFSPAFRPIGYACEQLLDQYVDHDRLRAELNAGQAEVLAEYAAFREAGGGTSASCPEGEPFEVIEFARRLTSLEKMEAS